MSPKNFKYSFIQGYSKKCSKKFSLLFEIIKEINFVRKLVILRNSVKNYHKIIKNLKIFMKLKIFKAIF